MSIAVCLCITESEVVFTGGRGADGVFITRRVEVALPDAGGVSDGAVGAVGGNVFPEVRLVYFPTRPAMQAIQAIPCGIFRTQGAIGGGEERQQAEEAEQSTGHDRSRPRIDSDHELR